MESGVWRVKCEVWSVECKVWSVKWGVLCVERGVESVDFGLRVFQRPQRRNPQVIIFILSMAFVISSIFKDIHVSPTKRGVEWTITIN